MSCEWSSPLWEDRVRIALGYPRHGWVLLAFMTAAFNQHVVVRCSDVYCPLPEVEKWLRRILKSELPARLLVDEEGHFKLLLALPLPEDPDSFGFHVSTNSEWNGSTANDRHLLFKCRTKRVQFVKDFASEVSRWMKEDWHPDFYGGQYDEDDEAEFRTAKYLTKLDFSALVRGDA